MKLEICSSNSYLAVLVVRRVRAVDERLLGRFFRFRWQSGEEAHRSKVTPPGPPTESFGEEKRIEKGLFPFSGKGTKNVR